MAGVKIWWAMRLAIMWRYRGLQSYRTRHFRRSEDYFSQVLAIDAQHIGALVGRGVLRWRELGDYLGAITDLNAALACAPQRTPELLFYRGMAYASGGHYPAAIDDFEWLINHAASTHYARLAYTQLASLYAVADELPRPPNQLTVPTPLLKD